jgi:DNA ligase-associated metallophosphoesterase
VVKVNTIFRNDQGNVVILSLMKPAFPYRIREQQLWLSPDRCIYWEEEESLIVSDLHFGKTGHFRKEGIAVPQRVYREDLFRLLCQIQYFRPRRLLVVGDLFHSRENKELSLFLRWREDLADLDIHLIQGNHDILHDSWYEKAGIGLSKEFLSVGPFSFVHDIADVNVGEGVAARSVATGSVAARGVVTPGAATRSVTTQGAATESVAAPGGPAASKAAGGYYFSGHIHPGIRIRGMGRQHLQFPCFYFGGEYAVLPAFGRWTGTVSIDPAPEDNVFAILPGILQIQ